MCLRCSGIHRHMGTHISKVKSCTLDKWTCELVDNMSAIGNARAKATYEAKVPAHYPRPTGDQFSLEQWIRKKYEFRQFYSEEPQATQIGDFQPPAPRESAPSRSVEQIARLNPIGDLLGGAEDAPARPAPALTSPAPDPTQARTRGVAQPNGIPSVHSGWNSAPATPTVPRAAHAVSESSLLGLGANSFDKPKVSNQDILQMYTQQSTQAPLYPGWGSAVAFPHPQSAGHQSYYSYPSSPAPMGAYGSPAWHPPGM